MVCFWNVLEMMLRERFDIAFPQYVGLYKSMKKWLESEVEE